MDSFPTTNPRHRRTVARLVLAAALAATPVLAQQVSGDRIETGNGDLIVQPLSHATFAMSWNGEVVYVDPVGGAATFEGLPRPDLILVTDVHGDHMDAETLAAVAEDGTRIVAPQAVADELPEDLRGRVEVLANGDETEVLGIGIEAVPMYNLTEGRLDYHQKGRGNGYVATFAGTRVYIAGDTEDIPEMRALEDIDVAFVPFNLPYTMTEEQAADAVREFAPDIVYPYHYRGSDVDRFAELVGEDSGVEVRIGEWY
ncbi:MAG: MBL fold metallo-hydrolase [Gammaproteobacteria bacterium]|nr:MBL fold metallo-hydrolase [Gammaproteobacteria bacterium]